MGNAIGYVTVTERVSGRSRARNFHGSEEHRQKREMLRRWCHQSGHSLRELGADAVQDLGESLADRCGLVKALHRLSSRGTKVLLIVQLADLRLDEFRESKLLFNLGRRKIKVVEVATGNTVNRDLAALKRRLLGKDPQLARRVSNELRSLSRQATHRERKTRPGRKPFGTRPGELETLRRMLSLRRKKLSFEAIAATLNQEQRPTRRVGTKWTRATVRRIYDRLRPKRALK